LAQKANSFLWVGYFLAVAFAKFFFLVHFGSGFQIVGLVSLATSFQFAFSLLVKGLVNCGLRLFGVSFGQVTLVQLLFKEKSYDNDRHQLGILDYPNVDLWDLPITQPRCIVCLAPKSCHWNYSGSLGIADRCDSSFGRFGIFDCKAHRK
jgi:hypothetical protein